MPDISEYYCCLNSRERIVLLQTATAFIASVLQFVPVAVWEVFWLTSPDVDEAVKAAFKAVYGLRIVTMEGDGAPFEAIVPAEGWEGIWLSWELFVATPAATCPDGCQLSRVPNGID